MKKQFKQIRIRKPVFILIILIAILAIATPVLADYLGPDRVTTESHVETVEYGVWAEEGNKCLNKFGAPSDCIICEWEGSPGRACSPATYSYALGSRAEVVTTTITLPPATISGTLQNCTLQNGWCVTASELLLNSKEPLPGHIIITLEGTLNGEVFACTGSSCSVPLNEGNNSFTYWAISSWGDSSAKGTFTQKVDTVSPNVGLDVSGSNGENGWYVSQTTVTATGTDSTSGLFETLLSVDNGAWQSSAALYDGVYDVAVRAVDNAGNVSNSSTIISVDTTTPALNVSLNGTTGNNGWYISNVKASVMASDATSGIALLEFSADGGVYQSYISPISFSDGHHTYQFRATDKAGNVTESPLQGVFVDTTFPAISLTEESAFGDTFYYDAQDNGSELAIIRVVIEDEDEHFQKVSWQEPLNGNKFHDEILWDGKFKDGAQAPAGTYYVTIKVADLAGNENTKTGTIKVELFSFLESIPAFTPPTSLVDPDVTSSTTQNPPTTSLSTGFGGTTTQSSEATSQSILILSGTSSSASTSSQSNVLWGAMAAAVISTATAYALEEKRKRKEAEAQQLRQAEAEAAKLNAAESARKAQEWQDGQNILNALIAEALAQGANADEVIDLKTQAVTQGLGVAIDSVKNLTQTLAEQNAVKQQVLEDFHNSEWGEDAVAAWNAQQAAAELAEQQAGLAAYYAGMKAGELEAASNIEESWWENTLNWIDAHPKGTSFGVGAIIGVTAIAATLAIVGTVTLPVLLLAAGIAAVAAGATVAAGTVALNNYNDRDLMTNVWSNVGVAATTAAIVSGIGLFITGGLLTQAVIATGNTVAWVCSAYPAACAKVDTGLQLLDMAEEGGLILKGAIQNLMGDSAGAAATFIELQLEQMDGGVPGNAVAAELGEQIAKLGDDAIDLIATYGDDIVPLLITYGDDAVDIIGAYGDEGVALLTMYGDDAAKLINEYGTPAVDFMIAHGDEAIELIDKYGDDVFHVLNGEVVRVDLENLNEFANDLAEVTGKKVWVSTTTGAIYVSKSKDDALDASEMLKDAFTAGDKEGVSVLVEIIAEGSTRGDGTHVVLGAWQEGDGYIQGAVDNGGIFFDTGKEAWDQIEASGIDPWLVNEQFLKNQLESGVDRIDYLGEDMFDVINNPDPKISGSFRAQEIGWLLENAKDYGYELVGNSWVFVKP